MIVIWVLTGAGYPWPLWVIGPWGAVMAGRWLVGSHPHGKSRGQIGGGGPIDPGQLGPGRGGDEGSRGDG